MSRALRFPSRFRGACLRGRSSVLRAALASLAIGFGRVAAAQAPEAAEYFDRAMDHVKHRQFERAVEDFQRAHALNPNHAVLYNLAQVYAAMGRPVDALWTFHECLALGGAELDAARIARIDELVEEQERKVALLRFDVEPRQVEISIDGEPARSLPNGTVPVRPGRVRLSVGAAGFRSASRDFAAVAGTNVRLEFRLQPLVPVRRERVFFVRCDVDGVSVSAGEELLMTLTSGAPPTAIRVPQAVEVLRFQHPEYGARDVDVSALTSDAQVDCGLEPPVARARAAKLPPDRAGSHTSRDVWALALASAGAGLSLTAGMLWLSNSRRAEDWGAGYCVDASSRVVHCGPGDRGQPASESERQALDDQRTSIRRWDTVSQGLALGGLLALGGAFAIYYWPEEAKQAGDRKRYSLSIAPRGVLWQCSF